MASTVRSGKRPPRCTQRQEGQEERRRLAVPEPVSSRPAGDDIDAAALGIGHHRTSFRRCGAASLVQRRRAAVNHTPVFRCGLSSTIRVDGPTAGRTWVAFMVKTVKMRSRRTGGRGSRERSRVSLRSAHTQALPASSAEYDRPPESLSGANAFNPINRPDTTLSRE